MSAPLIRADEVVEARDFQDRLQQQGVDVHQRGLEQMQSPASEHLLSREADAAFGQQRARSEVW
ncbi:hypothetical protein [Saccharopolyspora shandongensis]|uniref:hypothetical protein n=1 Tax=Saccharopolyspora shandongensis TaxID=418495 RepID=UPI00340626D2